MRTKRNKFAMKEFEAYHNRITYIPVYLKVDNSLEDYAKVTFCYNPQQNCWRGTKIHNMDRFVRLSNLYNNYKFPKLAQMDHKAFKKFIKKNNCICSNDPEYLLMEIN